MIKFAIAGRASLLAACAAAFSLAACNKPAEPAAAPAEPAPATVPNAAAPAAPTAEAASALPADVAALQAQFETCEHFAGEEPYDADRKKQIEDAIEANCKPVKAATPAIKAKYADNPAVMAVVKNWEELLGAYDG